MAKSTKAFDVDKPQGVGSTSLRDASAQPELIAGVHRRVEKLLKTGSLEKQVGMEKKGWLEKSKHPCRLERAWLCRLSAGRRLRGSQIKMMRRGSRPSVHSSPRQPPAPLRDASLVACHFQGEGVDVQAPSTRAILLEVQLRIVSGFTLYPSSRSEYGVFSSFLAVAPCLSLSVHSF